MYGYVAVTHHRWFEHLAQRRFWEEVNFWRPSAHHAFNGPPAGPVPQIGCILLSSAIFFPEELWIAQPADWAPRNLTYQRYDMEQGEGLRIWRECQERVRMLRAEVTQFPVSAVFEKLVENGEDRFGPPRLIRPRLGQGTFRVAVTDAYGRACAVTGEHWLPALEAAHIRPYTHEGPHDVSNGLLLRADLHRLFDQGYLTVTPDLQLKVGRQLREDYANGKSYYPFDNQPLNPPQLSTELPAKEYLAWHNERVFRG